MASNNDKRVRREISAELQRRGHGRHGPGDIGRIVAELKTTVRWERSSIPERVQLAADAWEDSRTPSPTRPLEWLDPDWPANLYGEDHPGWVLLEVELYPEHADMRYLTAMLPDNLAPALAVVSAAALLQGGGGTLRIKGIDSAFQATELSEFDQLLAAVAHNVLGTQPATVVQSVRACAQLVAQTREHKVLDLLTPSGLGQYRWVLDGEGKPVQRWVDARSKAVRLGDSSWTLVVEPRQNFDNPFDEVATAVMDGVAGLRPYGGGPADGPFEVTARTLLGDGEDYYLDEVL